MKAALAQHVHEMRKRLLWSVLAVLCIFAVLLFYANPLYTWLATPLLNLLPNEASLIATQVTSPFLAPLKLAFITAIVLSAPVILFQIWAFVAPGLYPKEKRMFVPLLSISVVLFYAGLAFSYWVVLPLVFRFFISVAPSGVNIMTDISAYLDFVVRLVLAFAIAFQLPVITVALIGSGLITADSLRQKRPYIIIGAFILGMLLTPPDMISQILLALPLWGLFELGILLSRFIQVREKNHQ